MVSRLAWIALLASASTAHAQIPLDAQGDPLPPGAIARFGTTRFRHVGPVKSIALSADGKSLASADSNSAIRLWDARTGKLIRRLERESYGSHSLQFTPNGKLLAGVDQNGTIRFWEVATGRDVRQLPGPQALAFPVQALAITSDGTTLAAGNDQAVCLWDLHAGKKVRQLLGHQGEIHSVAFSRDGKTLVSAGNSDKTVRVWNVATGQEVQKFSGGYPIALSPDGKHLALHEGPNGLSVRELATGQLIHKVTDKLRTNAVLAFSPDGTVLAWVDYKDNFIHLHELDTGKELLRLGGGNSIGVYSLAFSVDGKLLVSGGHDRLARLWDTRSGAEMLTWPGHRWMVQAIAFSPDRKTLITGSGESVWLWETHTFQAKGPLSALAKEEGAVAAYPLAISPNGKVLATGCRASDELAIRLWDLDTGKQLARLTGHQNLVRSLAFSPDGSRLASGSFDQTVRLWDVATGKQIHQFQGHQGVVYAVAYSPTGKHVASGSFDNTVRLWDTATGKETMRLLGHGRGVESLAFAPDGKILASGSNDKTIRFWDVAAGKEAGQPWREHESTVGALAFSADGRVLAAVSYAGVILAWERLTGQVVQRFTTPEFSANTAALAADGRTLVTGGSDSTALVWDLTGRLRDGQLPVVRHSGETLAQLWDDLGSLDGKKAWAALWSLVQAPGQSEAFLQDRLRPAPLTDSRDVHKWIADLGSDDFQVRAKAADQLENVAEMIQIELRAALAAQPPLEARRRIQQLLDRAEDAAKSPKRMRGLRAVHALEQLATEQARQALDVLAAGAPGARLSQDARAAWRRLAEKK